MIDENKFEKEKFALASSSASILAISIYPLLPIWQIMIPIGIISGLIAKEAKESFLAGFIGILVGWGALLGFQAATAPILDAAKLLSQIIGLGTSGWPMVILLTLLIGAMITGLSALIGAYSRKIVQA